MGDKKFTVEITKDGAEKARPSIWYWKHPMKQFIVEKSNLWKGMYSVAEGAHKGWHIDPSDCVVVKS